MRDQAEKHGFEVAVVQGRGMTYYGPRSSRREPAHQIEQAHFDVVQKINRHKKICQMHGVKIHQLKKSFSVVFCVESQHGSP